MYSHYSAIYWSQHYNKNENPCNSMCDLHCMPISYLLSTASFMVLYVRTARGYYARDWASRCTPILLAYWLLIVSWPGSGSVDSNRHVVNKRHSECLSRCCAATQQRSIACVRLLLLLLQQIFAAVADDAAADTPRSLLPLPLAAFDWTRGVRCIVMKSSCV